MKHIYAALCAALCAMTATAQTEVLKIELNDGTTTTIEVSKIKEMTFGTEQASVEGTYTGTNTVVVGGQYTYTAQIQPVITANTDGTVNLTWPQFELKGTIMGDLTLGSYTISDIPFNSEKGAYYLDYSDKGVVMHLKSVQNGNTALDKDYVLTNCSVLIEQIDGKIKITNPFKPGSMPFPIVSTFEGALTVSE